MVQATSISRISRRSFSGVVYNLELESNDQSKDDLFWVEQCTGIVTHNCLPKDLCYLVEALGRDAVVTRAAQYYARTLPRFSNQTDEKSVIIPISKV
jgi:hypothetical protein